MRAIFVLALLAVCCAQLPAQFSFSLMPSLNVPLGKDHFNTGFGASASLDWALLTINNDWKAGAALMGGMADFPVDYSSSFSILQAGLGPFVQWHINDRFSLQAVANAGVYRYSWDSESNNKLFAGAAISAQFHITPFFALFAETGITGHSFSDNQPINNFKSGIGVRFNLNELLRPPVRLKGEKTEQFNIFPVSFAWYEKNAVAMLRITNEEPNAITAVQLSFLLERYMNQPSVFAVIERLDRGESLEVPVKALFNESMLDLTETVNATVQIIAEYRSLGIKKSGVFPMQMPVYSRNSMTWDDDRRAASFVSPRDPAAAYFARYVSSAITGTGELNIPGNVRHAAALFEALRLFGINYIIDPSTPYTEFSENAISLDTLNFPYETLMYRGGDCDDLSILFASMLEALNVESAFITIPGHIYIAFDIGDDTWRRGSTDIIEHGGKRWFPVEITVPGRGFTEACRIGALQWRRAGDEALLYPMHESWQIYPSVSHSTAGDNLPSMPERNAIANALKTEMEKFK